MDSMHPDALSQLAQSSQGKKLKQLLRQDASPQVQEALKQMQSGDYSGAKTIIEHLMSSPEAARLIEQMRGGK